MIQANELRIGNLLQRLDGSAFEVGAYNILAINDYPKYLQPNPIPLTEEWLVKLGFEKRKDKTPKIALDIVCVWNKKQFFFFYESKNNFIAIDFLNSDDFGTKTTEIHYVHQLQNLYFGLTGEELTIKNLKL